MSHIITEKIIDQSSIEAVIKPAIPTDIDTRAQITNDIFQHLKNDSLSKEEITRAVTEHLEKQKLTFPVRILNRLFNDSSRNKARDAIITIDFLETMNNDTPGISQNNKDIVLHIMKQYHDIHDTINNYCQLTSFLISNLYNLCLDHTSYHRAFSFRNAKLSAGLHNKLKINVTSEIEINIEGSPLKKRTLTFHESDILKNPFASAAMKEYLYRIKNHLEFDFKKLKEIESHEGVRIRDNEAINRDLQNFKTDFRQKLDEIFKAPKIDWESDERSTGKLFDAIYNLLEHQTSKNVLKLQALRDEQQPAILAYYEQIKELRNKHKQACIYAVEQTHTAHTTVVDGHLSLPLLSPAESKELLDTFRSQLNLVSDNEKEVHLDAKIALWKPTCHSTKISISEKLIIIRNIITELRNYIKLNTEDIDSGISVIKNFYAAINNIGYAQENHLSKIKNIQDSLGPYDLSKATDGHPLSSFTDKQIRGFQTVHWIYDTPDILKPDEVLAIKTSCIDYIKSFVTFIKDHSSTISKLHEIESSPLTENLKLINTEIHRQHDNILEPLIQLYQIANTDSALPQKEFNALFKNKRRKSKIIEEALEKFSQAKIVLQKFDNSKEPLGIISQKEALELDVDNMRDAALSQYYENKVNIYLTRLGISEPKHKIQNTTYAIPRSTHDLPQPETVPGDILNTKK